MCSSASAAPDKPPDAFNLTLTPYLWFAGVNGDLGVGPINASIDASFTDLDDATDTLIGAAGRIEARTQRIGFYGDVAYKEIGVDDIGTPFGSVDTTTKLVIAEFALLVPVGAWPLGSGETPTRISLDALVGGRYMHVEGEIQAGGLGNIEETKDWIDPIIGVESNIHLNRHWSIFLHGDIGGFGAASDLTWGAAAYLNFWFPLGSVADGSVFIGYKAIGDDYETGSGLDRLEWDAILHGPVFGMNFQF